MSGSSISWAICKSAPRSRQITTPAPNHSSFLQAGCPSCRPTNSVKALKAEPHANSGRLKSVNISQCYKQERDCLGHFLRLSAVCWPGAHETTTLLLVTLPNIHRLKITHTLSIKPFSIWLLTPPPHLKYVAATLPCNLSLMACFADINVSQGSVETHARCGGIFNFHLTANLLRNLPVKKFLIG